MLTVCKRFTFEAAHLLPGYAGACVRRHGHSYKLFVEVEQRSGMPEPTYPGMVIDFGELKRIVKKVIISIVDHCDLNSIVQVPTAENLVVWIRNQLLPHFGMGLVRIRLYETEDSYAEWKRDYEAEGILASYEERLDESI